MLTLLQFCFTYATKETLFCPFLKLGPILLTHSIRRLNILDDVLNTDDDYSEQSVYMIYLKALQLYKFIISDTEVLFLNILLHNLNKNMTKGTTLILIL